MISLSTSTFLPMLEATTKSVLPGRAVPDLLKVLMFFDGGLESWVLGLPIVRKSIIHNDKRHVFENNQHSVFQSLAKPSHSRKEETEHSSRNDAPKKRRDLDLSDKWLWVKNKRVPGYLFGMAGSLLSPVVSFTEPFGCWGINLVDPPAATVHFSKALMKIRPCRMRAFIDMLQA